MQDPEELLKEFIDYRKRLHRAEGINWSLPPKWYPPKADVLVVEVVGSKWKTTVAYLLAANLSFFKKVGLFTSPHLMKVSERIQIWRDGKPKPIADSELSALLMEVRNRSVKEKRRLSYFEALFLASMAYFSQEEVGAIVLEAGLGGRLDATNSVRNDVVVMTKLELEHTSILGDSLESILREKAGVVKQGTKIVFAKADLSWEIYQRYIPPQKLVLIESRSPEELAVSVLERLEVPITIRKVRVPGRMEKIRWGHRILLLDVAHTPDSVEWVLDSVQGNGWWLVVSLARDKDWRGIGEKISLYSKKIAGLVTIGIDEDRFFPCYELLSRFSVFLGGPTYGMDLSLFSEKISFFPNQIVLGSHCLVGEVRRWFMG